ncbi:mucin-like glycoprotein, partial [Trypanosoma conorhini]
KIYICVFVFICLRARGTAGGLRCCGEKEAPCPVAARQSYCFLASRCVFLPNAVAPPKTSAWGGGGMNFFSCGCRAPLRELSGPPPFSSLPLPALTLCAAPHRAPHFSLCFFFAAAPQPTGSAATLLPTPPPLFLLMALTVRRRAVCALALLALLCSSFVCGATNAKEEEEVNVSVDVSCPNAAKKLRWRIADKSNSDWNECPQAVKSAGSIEGDAYRNTLCHFAGSVYMWKFPAGGCPASQPAGGTDVVAFTMNCTAAANSALHNLSKGVSDTLTINATENPLGASGFCEFLTPSQPAAEAQSESQSTGKQQPADPPQQSAGAAAASSSARTHEGDRTRNGGSTATVGDQPATVAGPTGSQEQSAEGPQTTPTSSVDTAASSAQTADRAADAPGGTQTPSTPQDRSGTPNAAPASGDNEGTTTTTTTTATTHSSSDGNDAKSNADGSAINSNATQKAVANAADRSATSTLFVRAPLMLLLTAALACAAG